MKIINILFSNKKGGMEQAFVDYTEALIMQKNDVAVIIKSDMPKIYVDNLKQLGAKIYKVKNRLGYYDYPLIFKIRKIIKNEKAQVVISHSGRAMSIGRRACKNLCPVIGVNHSSNIKRSLKCNAIFVVNTKEQRRIMAMGKKFQDKVFLMPNMLKLPAKIPSKKEEGRTLVVGAIGRFVKAKGFVELIKAGKILHDKGMNFEFFIAGDGEEKENLCSLTKKLNLDKYIKFPGWIYDISDKFFDKIDIFCLPSHFEPFGIVLLQAMLHKKAIVSTNCEGANDIFVKDKEALISSKDNLKKLPETLAKNLMKVLKYRRLRNRLAKAGHKKLTQNYSMQKVGKLLNDTINEVVQKFASF